MKFFQFIFLILTLCSAVSSRAEMIDGIVAVVNDAVITRQQVQDIATPAIDSLRRQYPADSVEFQQKINDALTNSLELLIERQLILHYFDTAGYRLPDSAVDDLVQERVRERFGNRVTLMKTLQAEGMTFEQFREDVRDQYIESALRNKNVSQEIVVSPYQIERYFSAHQDDYKVEDEIKVRMIVLNKSADDTNTLALAQEIQEKIKTGASFAEMASVHSQGSQKNHGGDMGWLERSMLRKELADAAFALKSGEASDVIETPDACYLLLVEEKRPAHVRPINEVRDDIEKTLRARQHDFLQKKWIESLKQKTFIRIFA
ncbi:MAG TPA: peptidyl-prolyl cis-trans isomerase [Methylomirabilota bacterium]|nr:peptidyl-prolyl cis-trans isomerase [Methylomirabilota bacterium]